MRLPSCRILLLVAGLTAACAAACVPARQEASRADLVHHRVAADVGIAAETTFAGMRGRYALYRVRLTSEAGLVATGRLLKPGRSGDGSRHPAVLLNDGRELDSRVVYSLPHEFGDVVVLSLDYPRALPMSIDFGDALFRADIIREAAAEIPTLFSLGATYLVRRGDVEPERLAIAATSFAVPFAVMAAAADERFRNVALIYGAGDLDRVLAANLALRPACLRRAAAWLATRPFTGFEPERYVALIAPRPLVMVNGSNDPQMPTSAVRALYQAAREPKSLVWLETGHLMPADTALIHRLVDTAFTRLPVLRGVPREGGSPASAPPPAGPSSR